MTLKLEKLIVYNKHTLHNNKFNMINSERKLKIYLMYFFYFYIHQVGSIACQAAVVTIFLFLKTG